MSSSVSEENLEKRFQGATNTQDSIQTLSLWLVHHKAHYQKIVSSWMKVLQKAKISHRLTLFYLANDVIQNSKRKGFIPFLNAFAEVLREATLLVRDENIRPTILRVFNIWEERGVYGPEFVTELRAILLNSKVPATAPSKLLSAFKPEIVVKKLKTIQKLELATAKKLSSINLSKLNATNAEIIQQLKDRIHGQQFKRDFDESTHSLEELIQKMNEELNERNELILLLEHSEIYYDTQKGEAKVVANAYKNFGVRVKNLQKKLEEISATLPSPVPSPSIDAPSPSSDQELELQLPPDNAKELENLVNAPSPVGSPEGLNLPPDMKESLLPKSLGNPIPTLSNFFSHDHSGMPSWLETFRGKKEMNTIHEKLSSQKSIPSSSLDSRLSNLLQNIPNLPSGLQSSLFIGSPSGTLSLGETVDSNGAMRKDRFLDSSLRLTPSKDECSGQNTPLQDEDTHSSHSFFNKNSSGNKIQSPKDILKGLTNLINSSSGEKEDNQNNIFATSDVFNPQDNMTSFIKNSASPSSQLASSFFINIHTSLPPPRRTLSSTAQTSVNSYQTGSYDNAPSYSTLPPPNDHMSHIPSIVPSIQHDKYNYASQPSYTSNEYNPESELYNTDMDIDEDIPPPIIQSLPPVDDNPIAEPSRSVGGRRLSTLITVVTKDSPDQSNITNDHLNISNSDLQHNTTQEMPPSNIKEINAKLDESLEISVNEDFSIRQNNLSLPFFISDPPSSISTLNGQTRKEDNLNKSPNSLLRIETVQSHREHLNGRWYEEKQLNNIRGAFNGPFMRGPTAHGFFQDHSRNIPRLNFHPRPNWMPRFRPDMLLHSKRNFPYPPRAYGPPPKRFSFRGRGRGWGKPPPQF